MKSLRMVSLSLTICCLLLGIYACENDPYESGDGEYSYLRADFGEIQTGSGSVSASAVTDDNVSLSFSSPYTLRWEAKADTVYRALIYYNNVENGKVAPVSIVSVPVLRPKGLNDDEPLRTDPIVFESAWRSANGKYYNIGFSVKSGSSDDIDARQTIGLVPSSTVVNADGTKTVSLTFYHNQNQVPEYYSVRTYASIPLSDYNSGDTLILTIHTYSGIVTRTIVF